MIYLFNNCFLSRTYQLDDQFKHVWIGSIVDKLKQDPHYEETFDFYKLLPTATTTELDKLFSDIQKNYAKKKIVIYCDDEYFEFIYFTFFAGLLPFDTVKEMYEIDRIKENFKIGCSLYGTVVRGERDGVFVPLPITSTTTITPSSFSGALTEYRIELAYANALLGDVDAKQFLINRIDKMWNGFIEGPILATYVEQNLPAFMSNDDFRIDNLSNPTFITNYLKPILVNEVIPDKTLDNVNQLFGLNYLNYFFNVQNNNNLTESEYKALWDQALTETKKQFIENKIINPASGVKLGLLFPDTMHLDSVNPILWNRIAKNYNNNSWLETYKVNIIEDGTDNQTNGTV